MFGMLEPLNQSPFIVILQYVQEMQENRNAVSLSSLYSNKYKKSISYKINNV